MFFFLYALEANNTQVAKPPSRAPPCEVCSMPWARAPTPYPLGAEAFGPPPLCPVPVGGSGRSRSRSRSRPRPGPCPCPVPAPARSRWPGPVPIKRITYAVWPASSNLFQEYGGSTLFSKSLVRGKQYCEVGTIIEQKQEPNGCQSQLLDMKTLDVASLAAVFLERLRSRCCLPGVCFLEPF